MWFLRSVRKDRLFISRHDPQNSVHGLASGTAFTMSISLRCNFYSVYAYSCVIPSARVVIFLFVYVNGTFSPVFDKRLCVREVKNGTLLGARVCGD